MLTQYQLEWQGLHQQGPQVGEVLVKVTVGVGELEI